MRGGIPLAVFAAALVLAGGLGFLAGQRLDRSPHALDVTESPPPPTEVASAPPDAPPPAAVVREPHRIIVPRVAGLTVAQARQVLRSVGLRATLDEFERRARPQSRVTVQAPVEGSRAPRGSNVGLRTDAYLDPAVASSCGQPGRIALRDYGAVIVGEHVEVRTADAGQFLVMDTSRPVSDLLIRARRVRGPGRLRFDDPLRGPAATVLLLADAHRMAPGWPPHWGFGAAISGPGCWELEITGGEAPERLMFGVSAREWRRFWR